MRQHIHADSLHSRFKARKTLYMSLIETFIPDETATRAAGTKLASLCKAGDIIALYGGLGAGKTTLSRGVISALMGEETEVPSPTYTLVQAYAAPTFEIFHYDLYRLKHPDELVELGWDETQDGLALVEWPERAGGQLPAWRLDVYLTTHSDGRKLRLEGHGEDWQARLHDFTF